MPFGNNSWKSVWVSPSPLVTVIPFVVLEIHSQWEEEEVDRCRGFFAAGLENTLDVYPNRCGFPGFSESSLDLLRPSTQVHTPFL